MRKGVILYKGNSFLSYTEFSKFYNIPYDKLCRQLNNGTSLDEIVRTKASPFKIKFKGKTYNNKSELARAHNVTAEVFHNRLHNGKTIKEALTQKSREFIVDKKLYKNLKEFSEELGVTYKRLYYLINSKGFTPAECKKLFTEEDK